MGRRGRGRGGGATGAGSPPATGSDGPDVAAGAEAAGGVAAGADEGGADGRARGASGSSRGIIRVLPGRAIGTDSSSGSNSADTSPNLSVVPGLSGISPVRRSPSTKVPLVD